jgi:hypothetical protein
MGHAEPGTGPLNDQDVPDEVSAGPTLLEEQTEKTLIKKIDLHVLPFVVSLYLFSFLDRGRCSGGGGVPDSSFG